MYIIHLNYTSSFQFSLDKHVTSLHRKGQNYMDYMPARAICSQLYSALQGLVIIDCDRRMAAQL